jgi:hypothetical protein
LLDAALDQLADFGGLSVVAIALFLESRGNLIPHRFFKTG